MNALDEPLLPSDRAKGDGTVALNDDVVRQIRTILIDAGVTAKVMGLPYRAQGDRTTVSSDDALRQIRSLLIGAGVTAEMLDLPGGSARGPRLSWAPECSLLDDDAGAAEKGGASAMDLPVDSAESTGGEDTIKPLDSAEVRDSDDMDFADALATWPSPSFASFGNSEDTREMKMSLGSTIVSVGRRLSNYAGRRLDISAKSRRESLHDIASEHPIAKDMYNMFFLSKNWEYADSALLLFLYLLMVVFLAVVNFIG